MENKSDLAIKSKLSEMLLVSRPTSGDGRIPTVELPSILAELGYDFLIENIQ